MLMSVVYLIWSVVELVAGILGVKNCNKPEKAKPLFVLAIVLIIFAIASVALSMTSVGFGGYALLPLIAGLLLPVIFIIGAKQNMNS